MIKTVSGKYGYIESNNIICYFPDPNLWTKTIEQCRNLGLNISIDEPVWLDASNNGKYRKIGTELLYIPYNDFGDIRGFKEVVESSKYYPVLIKIIEKDEDKSNIEDKLVFLCNGYKKEYRLFEGDVEKDIIRCYKSSAIVSSKWMFFNTCYDLMCSDRLKHLDFHSRLFFYSTCNTRRKH